MTVEAIAGELSGEALRSLELREWREDKLERYMGLLGEPFSKSGKTPAQTCPLVYQETAEGLAP